MGERVGKARDEKKVGNLDEFHCSKHADRLLDFFVLFGKKKKEKFGRESKSKNSRKKLGSTSGEEKARKKFLEAWLTAATGIVGADSPGTRRGRHLSR